MSERYTKVELLPRNMYLEGAPILIEAAALLKDGATGCIVAQLKLRNLQDSNEHRLIACKVGIRAFDVNGAELEGVGEYAYLDLSVARGDAFGTQEPIVMPDNTTRHIEACVVQTVYDNGSIWQHEPARWEQVAFRRQPVTAIFSSLELAQQYSIEVGGDCRYLPEVAGGLFFCTCGTINLERQACSRCGRTYGSLLDVLDVEALERKKDERLAREEQERAEKERAARARRKKIVCKTAASIAIAIAIVAAAASAFVLFRSYRYQSAERLLAEGDYDGAIQRFESLRDYKDAPDQLAYANAEKILDEAKSDGDKARAAIAFAKCGEYSDAKERSRAIWDEVAVRDTLSTGFVHSAGLRPDGTVVATGDNAHNECEVSGWSDIVAISAGTVSTIGLKSDGTVVAAGSRTYGECEVSDWKDIVAISAGDHHTVGLKSDGTVVVCGENLCGECDVAGWKDIMAVSAGAGHTIGLKTDGTVVAAGNNDYGQIEVRKWADIVAISAGVSHTVGVKSDGTVIAVGYNGLDECDVGEWSDVVSVSAGYDDTVGLTSDGTLFATGANECGECDVEGWTGVAEASVGMDHTVALTSDGKMLCKGDNQYGQCDVNGSEWKLKVPD